MTTASQPAPYHASRSTLGKASLAALASSAVILTIFVLPAEYGIDPTGIGKSIGLTAMAEGEDAGDESAPDATTTAAATLVIPEQVKASIEQTTQLRNEERKITLAPHTGVEVKARMNKGQHLIFNWTSTAPVRMDMHGEPKAGPAGKFSTYWKQKNLSEAQGAFTAPYEGTHGWYWRNGGETPVTITLKVTGFYGDLFEPPLE